jgi:hypothetical protein
MSGSSLPTTIKGVAPSRAGPGRISYLPDSGDAPRQEDVVGALDVSEPRKPGLKAKLYDELRRFLMIFARARADISGDRRKESLRLRRISLFAPTRLGRLASGGNPMSANGTFRTDGCLL